MNQPNESIKSRFVRVVACVTSASKQGALTRQIPTFYLETAIQGIQTYDQAKLIATKVINSLNIPAVVIDMTVTEVYDID